MCSVSDLDHQDGHDLEDCGNCLQKIEYVFNETQRLNVLRFRVGFLRKIGQHFGAAEHDGDAAHDLRP
jgi:hypothetical protein